MSPCLPKTVFSCPPACKIHKLKGQKYTNLPLFYTQDDPLHPDDDLRQWEALKAWNAYDIMDCYNYVIMLLTPIVIIMSSCYWHLGVDTVAGRSSKYNAADRGADLCVTPLASGLYKGKCCQFHGICVELPELAKLQTQIRVPLILDYGRPCISQYTWYRSTLTCY